MAGHARLDQGPSEILQLIMTSRDATGQPILRYRDLYSLTMTCHRLSHVADAILYQRSKDEDNSHAVCRAAGNGSIITLEKALSFGLDIHGTYEQSPLHLAAQAGHDSVINWLLDRGVHIDYMSVQYDEINNTDWDSWWFANGLGSTALYVAMCEDQTSSAITLLSRGAALEPMRRWHPEPLRGFDMYEALSLAIYEGRGEVLEYLVNHRGVDLNAKRNAGYRQLVDHCRKNPQFFRKLLNLGANVNGPGSSWFQSHLSAALNMGLHEVAYVLLQAGARVDDDYIPLGAATPWTPYPLDDLCSCCEFSDHNETHMTEKLLRLLIALGADVNRPQVLADPDSWGISATPLDAFLKYGSSSCVKMIIDAGAKLTSENLLSVRKMLQAGLNRRSFQMDQLVKAEVLVTALDVTDEGNLGEDIKLQHRRLAEFAIYRAFTVAKQRGPHTTMKDLEKALRAGVCPFEKFHSTSDGSCPYLFACRSPAWQRTLLRHVSKHCRNLESQRAMVVGK